MMKGKVDVDVYRRAMGETILRGAHLVVDPPLMNGESQMTQRQARRLAIVLIQYDQFNDLSLPEDVRVIGVPPRSTADFIGDRVALICESDTERFPHCPAYGEPYRVTLEDLNNEPL